ncbi:MAG: hypothetical protein Q4A46_04575, partial [Clostridia bacterium]|nr:hypothetical protein [Clostridia bacterium]
MVATNIGNVPIEENNPPTITCNWSESPVFEGGKTYSVSEFDSLMKTADDEWVALRKNEIEEYGSDEAVFEAYQNGDLDEIHLGYAKTKFTVNMPDGTKHTERQDIGDGDGGVIDFLSQYQSYQNIVPVLKRAAELTPSENFVNPTINDVSTDNELDYVDAEEIRQQLAEQQKFNTPAWEQKKKVKGFDLHPDVSMVERHTFNLRENEVETVGKKERFRRNIMAIQLLKKCQEENRFATPEEQIILSKYVGWGGLSEAFDENN